MTKRSPGADPESSADEQGLRLASATQRTTIRDVAKRAGCSIGTASKALNANGRLSLETREKVRKAAAELGYRPNDLALSLHRKKSFTVGILTTDSFGRFCLPIVEALERQLGNHGIAVFMCNATDDPARERQHIDQLLSKQVDGLVATARRADRRPPLDIGNRELPIIYVFSQTDDPKACCLLPDDEGGAMLAVRHLASLGRKRIAHVTGPEHFEAVRLRRLGCRRALAAAGLEEVGNFFLTGAWSESWGRAAVDDLFDGRCEPPDAIFCGNDQIARGAADRLRELGIEVPTQVSIVGFDNWNVMTEASRPPLTSIDMNLSELGREAGKLLIRMISGERIAGVQRMPCTLRVRQSCGAAASELETLKNTIANGVGNE